MKALRNIALLTLILFSILIMPAKAQQNVDTEKLEQFFTQLAENNRFMGSVAVLLGDDVVFNEAYGMISADGFLQHPKLFTE